MYELSKPFKIKDKQVLVFDIECDGFLDDLSKIHCVAIKPYNQDKAIEPTLYFGEAIPDAIRILSGADYLVAHNGIGYDIPAINKLYPDVKLPPCIDTLLLTKLYNPFLPSYSLRELGILLKEHKGDYDKGFEFYNHEMGVYCQQDVVVTTKLFNMLIGRIDISASHVVLEHEVKRIQCKGERRAVGFNYKEAMKLFMELTTRMDDIKDAVEPSLGYAYKPYDQTYKLKKDGTPSNNALKWLAVSPNHVQGGEFCKVEYEKITLDTKKLLVEKLLENGWIPSSRTEKGYPQIAVKGEVCQNLLEMGDFADVGLYFVLKHRKGLVEGLFKLVRKDGRIESRADTLGAVTHRYTHMGIANFPAVRSLYGEEIRSLFGAFEEDRVFVGSDLAGLEARMLAHFMDDDEFTELVSGPDADVHTFNQHKVGLPTRDAAKTFYYALLYGGGNAKIGALVNGDEKDGERIKKMYFEEFPGLKATNDKLQKEANKGFITSLDGRPIRITKGSRGYDTHKALNSLLQSSGAIFAKHWLVFTNKYLETHDVDATVVISYHDELQIDCHKNCVEFVTKALRYGVEMSDKILKTNCPNDIDIKVGKNWKDTH